MGGDAATLHGVDHLLARIQKRLNVSQRGIRLPSEQIRKVAAQARRV